MPFFRKLFGKRCRLCGALSASPMGSVAPTHPGPFHTESFQLCHCASCEVVYLDPLPTAGDLEVLYKKSVQFSDPHYTDPAQVAKILGHYESAVRGLHLLQRPDARVLEIGAGLAWLSRVCKTIEPGVSTTAQDVSAECAQSCPWVDRYLIGDLEVLEQTASNDLVCLTHVIEHLPDPARTMRLIAGLVAPEGKIYITAPFRPSGWKPSNGIKGWGNYSYLHVPAHITYFSRKWFARQAADNELKIVHWDASHEDGQAFELVMQRP